MTSKEAVNLFKQYHWKVKDKEKALEVLEELVEQSQKQEKLLKLYREKDKYIKVFTPLPKVELDKYRNIVKQIKELENGK